MTQPPEGFIPIIGYVDPNGDPVPRSPKLAADDRTPEGQARTDTLNMGEAWGHRRPFTRKIEVTVDEEVVAGLRSFSEGYFKATGKRLGEEEAVLQLVVDGLISQGHLPVRR